MPLETWDDWMAAGEKMKAAGHAMCAFDKTSLNEFIMEYYQSGGQLFDKSGELAVEEDRAYKALELVISAAKRAVSAGPRKPIGVVLILPHSMTALSPV